MIALPPVEVGPVLRFRVRGKPVSKGRPRAEVRFRSLLGLAAQLINAARGASTPRERQQRLERVVRSHLWVHVHPPDTTETYEQFAAGSAHLARAHLRRRGEPMPEPPYAIRVVVVLPRPKRLKTGPRVRPAVKAKPDTNNVVSAILDAMQRGPMGGKREKGGPPVGVIEDDAQVTDVHAFKVYASSDEQPHVEVELTHAGGPW